jgi:hypothetical protein
MPEKPDKYKQSFRKNEEYQGQKIRITIKKQDVKAFLQNVVIKTKEDTITFRTFAPAKECSDTFFARYLGTNVDSVMTELSTKKLQKHFECIKGIKAIQYWQKAEKYTVVLQSTSVKQLMRGMTDIENMFSLNGDAMNALCAYKLTNEQKFVPNDPKTQTFKPKKFKETVNTPIDILKALGAVRQATGGLAELANKTRLEWYNEDVYKLFRQQQRVEKTRHDLMRPTEKSWIRPGLAH